MLCYTSESRLTNFDKFSVFVQNLKVAEPDAVVGDTERDDVVNEWFAAWVMVWRTERLKYIGQYHVTYNAKSFPIHKAERVVLIFVSLALSQTPVYTTRPRICG